MRKSSFWVAGFAFALGIVVSCGESQSDSTADAAGGDAEGGASSGASGSSHSGVGGTGKGGSAVSSAGEATGGDDGSAGASGASGGSPPEISAGTGGTESTGGANGGAGGLAEGGSGPLGDGGALAGAGGAGGQAPSCDDGKPETEDLYSELYGCAHLTDDIPGGGDGWLYYDAGFYVDERTGSAWTPVTQGGTLEFDQAYCADLQLGNLGDWHVPTIDQVRASFAAGCPATAPTGSCPIHDPTNLSSAEVYSAACESCLGSGTSAYCPKNAPFCQWLKTSSLCSDCTGSKSWAYGPSNGNFAALDVASAFSMSCVIESLPGGVP